MWCDLEISICKLHTHIPSSSPRQQTLYPASVTSTTIITPSKRVKSSRPTPSDSSNTKIVADPGTIPVYTVYAFRGEDIVISYSWHNPTCRNHNPELLPAILHLETASAYILEILQEQSIHTRSHWKLRSTEFRSMCAYFTMQQNIIYKDIRSERYWYRVPQSIDEYRGYIGKKREKQQSFLLSRRRIWILRILHLYRSLCLQKQGSYTENFAQHQCEY